GAPDARNRARRGGTLRGGGSRDPGIAAARSGRPDRPLLPRRRAGRARVAGGGARGIPDRAAPEARISARHRGTRAARGGGPRGARRDEPPRELRMIRRRAGVLILGAGLLGSGVALELARQGHEVTLLDQDARAMNRASLRNEGKIHLGLIYANDASLATALL